jgi:nickel/cobalt transporter regulator
MQMPMPMPHGGQRFEFHRIGRGGMLPPFFMGPQFFIPNWQVMGFPAPMTGGRWVRYYDDALLVDRDGRVMDSRYGADWDRYGDRWAYDDNGVPAYVGDGDYDPQERDYEWAERMERDGARPHDRYAHDGRPMPDRCGNPCTRVRHAPPAMPDRCDNPCTRVYQAPRPHGGYDYGYGYGYGYGCGCGPIVVTETTTTTAPTVETRTYYEYVTVERPAPRRHYRKPVRRAPPPPPRPRPGERG